MAKIPYTLFKKSGNEERYLAEALQPHGLASPGRFKQACEELLATHFSAEVQLTQSCTSALEVAALLTEVGPGDEVILPSFTFSSTANAFALRGATLVFVDIDEATLNIDPLQVEQAINEKTKVIVPVHYAGVSCAMQELLQLAGQHGLMIVEDAAQALGSTYHDKPVGTQGDLSTLSFHNTKNIVSGEGGALIINNPELAARASWIVEKGTNRSEFFLGQVDKYTWVDVGTSAIPSELTSALLLAQLEQTEIINTERIGIWEAYHAVFETYEEQGLLRRPVVPAECTHNGHIYYLLMNSAAERDFITQSMSAASISAPFHYIPLHSAPAGLRFGRSHGDLTVTDSVSQRLVRLPIWPGMETQVGRVIETFADLLKQCPHVK